MDPGQMASRAQGTRFRGSLMERDAPHIAPSKYRFRDAAERSNDGTAETATKAGKKTLAGLLPRNNLTRYVRRRSHTQAHAHLRESGANRRKRFSRRFCRGQRSMHARSGEKWLMCAYKCSTLQTQARHAHQKRKEERSQWCVLHARVHSLRSLVHLAFSL